MARRLFDNLLDSATAGGKKKRAVSLPVSIGIHVAVLSAVILVPILMSGRDLPEPALGAVSAFFVEPAPPPPPPPPPPPAAAKPKTATAPKVEQPKPVVREEPKFTAPIETPKEVTKSEGVDTGVADGVDEGVTGGVAGGSVGGVEGGTVGGMHGGTVGGAGDGGGGGLGDIPAPAPPPPPPPPPKVEPPKGPVRVGGKISEPRKTRNVPPVYPEMAKHARVQGTVILEATISPQGRVMDLKVLRGIPLLDDAAMNAVKQWTYSPTLLNGQPVPVIMTVTVNFRLDGSSGGSSSAAKPKPSKAEPKESKAQQTYEPEPPAAPPAAAPPAPAPAQEAPAPAPPPAAEPDPAPEATPPPS
jgi:periplasmic protein TonB